MKVSSSVRLSGTPGSARSSADVFCTGTAGGTGSPFSSASASALALAVFGTAGASACGAAAASGSVMRAIGAGSTTCAAAAASGLAVPSGSACTPAVAYTSPALTSATAKTMRKLRRILSFRCILECLLSDKSGHASAAQKIVTKVLQIYDQKEHVMYYNYF